MSNVTPTEIVRLVAAAWNVPLDAIAEPAPWDRRQNPLKRPSYAARACAIMLIRKHTTAHQCEINRALGMRYGATAERHTDLVEKFRRFAVRNLEVVWRIETIEQQIDDLHEQRTGMAFSAPAEQCQKQVGFQ